MKKIVITLGLFLVSLILFSQELSKAAWLEDLDAYKMGLEQNHINVYHTINKAEFEKELQSIETLLESRSDLEIAIELMRLTRKIGDGHTAISFRNQQTHNYPFELKNFEGKWKVIRVDEMYSYLLGKELVKINDYSINKVAKKVEQVAQFVENEYSRKTRTSQYLNFSELLYGLGITNKKTAASFTFTDETGLLQTKTLHGLSQDEYNNHVFRELKIAVPEIKTPGNIKTQDFWYAPIAGTDGLYIHFESYPTFEEMMTIGEEIVGHIFEANIRQLVIDMRNNGGGDLYTGLVLAYALNLADPVDWESGVYVLSDNVTFSAATSNTALYRELLNAKIVGEPSGSNPTGYQDMDSFELPNSKLVVCYSKRFFNIQETRTAGVQPDVLLNYDWDSFSQNNDNILRWVIDRIKAK
ncbi:hypothetical protein [Saccharicrinis sp. GN24d3]|uniref:hypothetical protein n=1 Tax=Saccharicrinis sp. GN24d3 TaxID=3458416 RepID=UPI0040372DB3